MVYEVNVVGVDLMLLVPMFHLIVC